MTDAITGLRFQRRPSPVLAEHRPLYKICQVLLVLQLASRAGRSKLPRLHLFNWALKSSARRDQLVTASKEKVLQVTAWGFDPALAIAIRYAIAERLVRETSTGYELTDEGALLAKDVMKLTDVFVAEKSALLAIGKGITEGMVEDVANGWEA